MSSKTLNYTDLLRELSELSRQASISKDPVSEGLDYFNRKYSEIQSARERVLSIILDALWNRSELDAEISKLKQEYSTEYAKILVRDDVKPLKSSDLREAVANNELNSYVSRLATLERDRIIADAFYRNAVLVYEDLKDKNDNIGQQLLTVRAMLNLNPDLRDALEIISKTNTNTDKEKV
jgi:hypothetical protein